MSQDPVGDGVNWYAYVGSNPVVWVDPEGLWGADCHREWSLAAAGEAGFSGTYASLIATAAEEIDFHYDTIGGLPHFPTEYSWEGYITSQTLQAEGLWRRGEKGKALQALGRALHALQDSTIHPESPSGHYAPGFSEDPKARPMEARRAQARTRAWLRRFAARVNYGG